MAQRGQWEDRYGWDIQSSISSAQLLSDGVDSTTGELKAGVLLNDHPHLEIGQQIIDTEKTTGSASKVAGDGMELNQGTIEPSFSLSFDASCKVLYVPLHITLQKGSLQEGTSGDPRFAKWFFPYSYESAPAAAEVWATFVRQLAADGTSDSHQTIGMIGNSLTLSSNVNETLVCSLDVMARDVDTSYATSATGDNFNITNDATLLWQNATTQIGDGTTAQKAVDLDGFSLTINVNPTRKFYSSNKTSKFLMGKVVAEGTIKVPWTNSSTDFLDNVLLENFIAGTPTRFSIFWGSQIPDATNEMSINFIARFTGGVVGQDEDEIVTELPFQCVEYTFFDSLSGNQDNITAWAWLTPDITLTLDAGLVSSGNILPGDTVQLLDEGTAPASIWQILNMTTSTEISPVLDIGSQTITGTPGSEAIVRGSPFNIGIYDGLNRSIT